MQGTDLGHASHGTLRVSLENRAGEHYSLEKKEEVRRGCSEQDSKGGKQEFRVVMVSHWLSGGRFSLAGLLLGKEEIFLLPAGVVK